MDSELYRTARKREFAAMMAQLAEHGLRPADVARLLKKTKASISKYLSGKQNPPESTLVLLRHVVDRECGGVEPQKPDPAVIREEALAYGRKLALLAPENQAIVKQLIDRLGPSREMIQWLGETAERTAARESSSKKRRRRAGVAPSA